MNAALKRFLADLAEEYRARTGLDIGDLPEIAQDAVDGKVVSPLREPTDIGYANAGGYYPIAGVDSEDLAKYPHVVEWAHHFGVDEAVLLEQWSNSFEELEYYDALGYATNRLAEWNGIPGPNEWEPTTDHQER